MQLSPEYWRSKSQEAFSIARTIRFIEGPNSQRARDLWRRGIRWERKAKEAEAHYER